MAGETALISPGDFLAMHFRDRQPEYVRGELLYKPMPDIIHGTLQALLVVMLYSSLNRLGFRVATEVRCQVEKDIYRLPDVAVFAPDHPDDLLPKQAAFLTVEIVSKDEKFSELLEKLEDYRAWGVSHIWVVDPWRRQLSVFDSAGLRDVDVLRLPEQGFELTAERLLENLPLPDRKRTK